MAKYIQPGNIYIYIENWQKSEINPDIQIVSSFIPIETEEPKMNADSISTLSLTL
jgi:hypothetical protein